MHMYRIFEVHDDGHALTLFHGVDRSRKLPLDEWVEAENKNVRDGSDGTEDESGFHVTRTRKQAAMYMEGFTAPRNLVICRVQVDGRIREKEHSPSPILLVDKMKIHREDWENATNALAVV